MDPSIAVAIQNQKELNEAKRKLDVKRYQYKKKKLTRYFYHHKGRTLIIFICIIILCICVFTQYPIDGSIDTETYLSKFMSLLGYIASSVFVALSLSVLAVETYLSREELNKIDEELTNELNKNINRNAGHPDFLTKLSNYIDNLVKKRIFKRKNENEGTSIRVVPTNTQAINNTSPTSQGQGIDAASEVINTKGGNAGVINATGSDIEDLKEKIYYLSSDQKYKLFDQIETILKESTNSIRSENDTKSSYQKKSDSLV
jgi:hypothetical protein